MTKTLTIAASVALVASVGAIYEWQSLIKELEGRFPEIDKKILRKAYRKMMINSVTGKYADLELDNDDKMDRIFKIEVALLIHKAK